MSIRGYHSHPRFGLGLPPLDMKLTTGTAGSLQGATIPGTPAMECNKHLLVHMRDYWQCCSCQGLDPDDSADKSSASTQPLQQALLEQQRAIVAAANQLWASVLDCACKLSGMQPSAHLEAEKCTEELQRIVHVCDETGHLLAELQVHVDQLVEKVAPLTAAADIGCGVADVPKHVLTEYRDVTQACVTGGLDLDQVFLGLSDCYAHVRSLLQILTSPKTMKTADNGKDSTNANGSQWVPPDEFKRSTTKYWVRPEHLPRLRVALLRHLPLLVFGRQEGHLVNMMKEQAPGCGTNNFDLKAMSATSDNTSSRITSIYLDGPMTGTSKQNDAKAKLGVWPFAKQEAPEAQVLKMPLPVYHSRLRRDHNASVVRIRWYGARPSVPEGKVFVERKVHCESWTGLASTKERASLPLSFMPAFLSGTSLEDRPDRNHDHPPSNDEQLKQQVLKELKPKHLALMKDVQGFITGLNQSPVLSTVYNRYAFQRSDTNSVRISIDTQLRMPMESVNTVPWADFNSTGRITPCNSATAEVQFPYAVLEVKLEDKNNPPAWIQDLKASGMLVEVPKFSKFLHGMALLYPQAVRNTPAWFVPSSVVTAAGQELQVMRPATIDEVEAASKPGCKDALREWLFPVKDQPLQRLPGQPSTTEQQLFARACIDQGSLAPAQQLMQKLSVWSVEKPSKAGSHYSSSSNNSNNTSSSSSSYAGNSPLLLHQPDMRVHAAATETVDGLVPDMRVHANIINDSVHTSLGSSGNSESEGGAKPIKAESINHSLPSTVALNISSISQATKPASRVARALKAVSGRFSRKQRIQKGDLESGGILFPTAAAMVRSRIEPKTFFANERTFLTWVNLAVMIMFVSLSLLATAAAFSKTDTSSSSSSSVPGGFGASTPSSSGGGQFAMCPNVACRAGLIAGLLIAPASLIFLGWALFMYRKRTLQILNRDNSRYDDQRGPLILVVLLLVVFSVAYALTVTSVA